MKLYLECISCYIRQAFEAAQMATDDKKLQEEILRASLIAASKFNTDKIGLLTHARIQKAIKKIARVDDPYKEAKEKINSICLDMSDEIRKVIANSRDHFETSLRIALAGNIIDFGQGTNFSKNIIKHTIDTSLHQNLDKNKVETLRENINKAGKILYIGDNTGEIVFDKIFIEQLPKDKITFVVRGGPAMNDSTMEDAKAVGMTDIVKVITTGLDMAASILPLCSKKFLNEYKKSDLIIAKGQGNYEALSDEEKNIFFLLKIKCPVIAKSFKGKYNVGDIVVDTKAQNGSDK